MDNFVFDIGTNLTGLGVLFLLLKFLLPVLIGIILIGVSIFFLKKLFEGGSFNTPDLKNPALLIFIIFLLMFIMGIAK